MKLLRLIKLYAVMLVAPLIKLCIGPKDFMEDTVITSKEDYLRYISTIATQERLNIEQRIAGRKATFRIIGYCHACGRTSYLKGAQQHCGATDGPNWREVMFCTRCFLNARMRASVHFFTESLHPTAEARIFIMEQVTEIYRWYKSHYPNTTGSEFLGDSVPFGKTNRDGIRNENAMALTFGPEEFDFVLSFDVLEHVPAPLDALRQCHRVLKPEGIMLMTVPIEFGKDTNMTRAELLADGSIRHILPEAYHGNPLKSEGSLVFTDFGWRLIEQMQEVGFRVTLHPFWAREYGYFGNGIWIIKAQKAGR